MAVTQHDRAPHPTARAGPDDHAARRMLASIVAVFVIALAGIFLVEALAGSSDPGPYPAREVDVDVDPGGPNGR